jgi:hypothetical protein
MDRRETETSLSDFTGIVPARRGGPLRPPHPRLASLCCRPEAETSCSVSTGVVPADTGGLGAPAPRGGPTLLPASRAGNQCL